MLLILTGWKMFAICITLFFHFATVQGQGKLSFPTETTVTPSTPAVVPTESMISLKMNGAQPATANKTFCTGYTLKDESDKFWIVGINPKAENDMVHHMALYGCDIIPTTFTPACGCPLPQRSPIFSWVGNTPAVRFTGSGTKRSAGFAVGSTTDIKYLFIEVHYRKSLAIPDYSTGLDLSITRSQPNLYLMILTIMGIGTIPKNTDKVFMDACAEVPFVRSGFINIFAMQPHTHGMGRLVSTYSVGAKSGTDNIYRANPLWPQAYYGLTSSSNYILGGDNIYSRCYFTSTGVNFDVNTNGMGPSTPWSEMCIANFIVGADSQFETTKNVFIKGSCSDAQKATINGFGNSDVLLTANPSLDLHAIYGNYTGVVTIDSTHSVNLDLETFTNYLG